MNKKENVVIEKQLQFLIYSTPDENVKVKASIKNDTLWLSQKLMGELFGTTSDNVGLHLKNIFNEGELDKNSVIEDFSVNASDGKN